MFFQKDLPDHPFDKEQFKEAMITAKGERSQAEFADDCALSRAYVNKYINGKFDEAPTIHTLRRIAVATRAISYEELLTAAGYNADKYKDGRPVKAARKDLLYPVFLGIANSGYDWRIESKGYKDNEPFEITIESVDVKKWFFIPVTKADITREEIQDILTNQPLFTSGCKVSFVTDNVDIYERLKSFEFPIFSLYVSVIRVLGQEIIDEVGIRTSLSTDMNIVNEDKIRPLSIL